MVDPIIARIFVFLFGSIVGSFLNVCIHRLPLEESIVFPGSHCPKCKKSIPWYDNIPFISYILLLGKCRFCKEKISPRYFAVEFITAFFFLVFFMRYGMSIEFLRYTVFVCALIIATFVDIQHRIIPDEISIGGIFVGLVFGILRGLGHSQRMWDWHPAFDSFLGIIAGGGLIWLIGFVFDTIYFKMLKKPAIQGETESMGGGDVKLLAMIGAFLGWKLAILTFFIAPFFGAVIGLLNLLVKKDHLIPYGPFLSFAAIICIFWSDVFLRFLLLK